MGLLRKLRRFASLPRAEKAVFSRSLVMILVIDAELRLRGWNRCYARLAASANPPGRSTVGRIPPERVAWLVEQAARIIPWAATCLRRSLALWGLLERSGTHTTLRLGFRQAAGSLEIHAWVELDGVPLNERRDVRSRYAVFGEPLAPRNWRDA